MSLVKPFLRRLDSILKFYLFYLKLPGNGEVDSQCWICDHSLSQGRGWAASLSIRFLFLTVIPILHYFCFVSCFKWFWLTEMGYKFKISTFINIYSIWKGKQASLHIFWNCWVRLYELWDCVKRNANEEWRLKKF